MTKHEKRGRVLIHIPGAWSYPSTKQVTPTHSVNVCMFCVEILLRPSFGMFCKQQTLLFTHKSRTAAFTKAYWQCKCKDTIKRGKYKINMDLFLFQSESIFDEVKDKDYLWN